MTHNGESPGRQPLSKWVRTPVRLSRSLSNLVKIFSSVLDLIIPLLFFYWDALGIAQHTKFDMPLNKKTKPNQSGFGNKFLYILTTLDL